MKKWVLIGVWMTALLSAGRLRALTIDPTVEVGRIDPRIYGFLLEHIYHSCDNGVWGEEIFNRSFEDRNAWWTTFGDSIAVEGLPLIYAGKIHIPLLTDNAPPHQGMVWRQDSCRIMT